VTTTPINHRQATNRLGLEAACARMDPDPDKLTATIATFTAKVATPGYWPLVADTMAKAVNLVHLVHAGDCRQPGCATCAAISQAVTATAAHYTVTGATR
jgi:hypothetical protein